MTSLTSRCYDGTVIKTTQMDSAYKVRVQGVATALIKRDQGSLAKVHRDFVRGHLEGAGIARL